MLNRPNNHEGVTPNTRTLSDLCNSNTSPKELIEYFFTKNINQYEMPVLLKNTKLCNEIKELAEESDPIDPYAYCCFALTAQDIKDINLSKFERAINLLEKLSNQPPLSYSCNSKEVISILSENLNFLRCFANESKYSLPNQTLYHAFQKLGARIKYLDLRDYYNNSLLRIDGASRSGSFTEESVLSLLNILYIYLKDRDDVDLLADTFAAGISTSVIMLQHSKNPMFQINTHFLQQLSTQDWFKKKRLNQLSLIFHGLSELLYRLYESYHLGNLDEPLKYFSPGYGISRFIASDIKDAKCLKQELQWYIENLQQLKERLSSQYKEHSDIICKVIKFGIAKDIENIINKLPNNDISLHSELISTAKSHLLFKDQYPEGAEIFTKLEQNVSKNKENYYFCGEKLDSVTLDSQLTKLYTEKIKNGNFGQSRKIIVQELVGKINRLTENKIGAPLDEAKDLQISCLKIAYDHPMFRQHRHLTIIRHAINEIYLTLMRAIKGNDCAIRFFQPNRDLIETNAQKYLTGQSENTLPKQK